MHYTISYLKMRTPTTEDELDHVELGSYDVGGLAPWVPRKGEFFRFRDFHPPNKEVNHTEVAGYVKDVVTVLYGNTTVIEVYITPRELL